MSWRYIFLLGLAIFGLVFALLKFGGERSNKADAMMVRCAEHFTKPQCEFLRTMKRSSPIFW